MYTAGQEERRERRRRREQGGLALDSGIAASAGNSAAAFDTEPTPPLSDQVSADSRVNFPCVGPWPVQPLLPASEQGNHVPRVLAMSRCSCQDSLAPRPKSLSSCGWLLRRSRRRTSWTCETSWKRPAARDPEPRCPDDRGAACQGCGVRLFGRVTAPCTITCQQPGSVWLRSVQRRQLLCLMRRWNTYVLRSDTQNNRGSRLGSPRNSDHYPG